MATLTYTVFSLGEAQLHQLHTNVGKLFVMGEVAVELFQESPTAFLQEIRKGKYARSNSVNRDVLHTIAELHLPVESMASTQGVVLLPAPSVEQLLLDKRRVDLVQPFRLALLKLSSQEAARLMAAGEYELALPVALDAVQQGQALFKPAPALQIFPLYLLAAQANLGLRRAKQCEDFLALASWLAMKEPLLTTNIMKSQLSRLYGQLYAFQSKHTEALHAFAEDVYYCSQEHSPDDVRTSLGYYNLGKVFNLRGDRQRSAACNSHVIRIWSAALQHVVLGVPPRTPMALGVDNNAANGGMSMAVFPGGGADGSNAAATMGLAVPAQLTVGRLQLMEVVDMILDISRQRTLDHGLMDPSVGETHFVCALALIQLEERDRAAEELAAAAAVFQDAPDKRRLLDMATVMLNAVAAQ
uniref:Uncharacterized protein n=1 Tax=Polytomella parva TaxID=51329 RepID=A0A7S0VMQ9_9CHLO|mmetsp:Transcript_7409/g.14587  ORF Transcript_7409/g.14587 Transcript_7409/m.14587 type:complete len:414 (+) Transcript_7409:56-1297(+)